VLNALEVVTAGAEETLQDVWIPCRNSLKIKAKATKWEKWTVHSTKDWRSVPLSPLSFDSSDIIRIIMGLESSKNAIAKLVARSIEDWKEMQRYRPDFVVVLYSVFLFAHSLFFLVSLFQGTVDQVALCPSGFWGLLRKITSLCTRLDFPD